LTPDPGSNFSFDDMSAISDSVFGQMEFADGWLRFMSKRSLDNSTLFFGYIERQIVVVKRMFEMEGSEVTASYSFPDLPLNLLPTAPPELLQHWPLLSRRGQKKARKLYGPFQRSLASESLYPEVEERLQALKLGDSANLVLELMRVNYTNPLINGPIYSVMFGNIEERSSVDREAGRVVFGFGFYRDKGYVCTKEIVIEGMEVVRISACDTE